MPLGKVNVIDVPNMEAEAKSMFEHFDSKRFEEGIVAERVGKVSGFSSSEQAVTDIVGVGMHVDAILESGKGLAKLPREHMELVMCESEHSYFGEMAMGGKLLSDKVCQLTTELLTMGEVILAQHKIEHVIQTLQKNKEVAHQWV